MSEQEFDSYLRLMSRFLRLSESQRDAIRAADAAIRDKDGFYSVESTCER